MEVTTRDRDILAVLTQKVRVLSVAQVARTWWRTATRSEAGALRRLKELEGEGLASVFQVLARPELELASPVLVWSPGEPAPDFASLAYQLRARWREPLKSTAVAMATERAGHWLGGAGGRRPRASETSHDLSLGALYLKFRSERPADARTWTSEALLYNRESGSGERLPDAMVGTRRRRRVVELGGSYTAEHLHSLHGYCVAKSLPYEVW